MPIETLSSILKPVFLQIQPDSNHTVILTEPKNNNKTYSLKQVTITNLPSQSIVLQLEPLRYSLFYEEGKVRNGHNLSRYRCKCDYIIVCIINQKGYIFYIEMKSSNINQDAKFQLFRGQRIMEYLRFSMQKIENNPDLMASYENRFVILLKIPLDKNTTTAKRDYIQSILPSSPNTDIEHFYPCDLKDRDTIPIEDLIYNPI